MWDGAEGVRSMSLYKCLQISVAARAARARYVAKGRGDDGGVEAEGRQHFADKRADRQVNVRSRSCRRVLSSHGTRE